MTLHSPIRSAAACAMLLFASPVDAGPARRGATAASSGPANPLWRDGKVRNYLPYMSWPEVEALLRKTDMVIIPVGAIEQHGLGGPIGTDYLNGTQTALLIAQKTDALVAPILLPSQSPYHMGFPGTITLSSETVQRVYVEAAQSLIQHGFRRFPFLNAHGGNTAATAFIVDRINQETPAVAVELGAAAATMTPAGTQDAARSGSSTPPPFDQHAGVEETSESLYLTPGLVDQHVARAAGLRYPPHLAAMVPRVQGGEKAAELVFMAEALKQSSTGKHSSTREMSDTGAWSELDPGKATAERGRRNVDRFVADAVAFINEWKRLRPLGVK